MIARALSRSPRPTATMTLSETIAGLVGASAIARSAAESAAAYCRRKMFTAASRRATVVERGSSRGARASRAGAPSQRPRLVSAIAERAEQVHVVGREAEPALVLRDGALVVDRVDAAVEVAGGEIDQRIRRPERPRPLGRELAPRRPAPGRHAVGVERGTGAGELAPRLRECRVE